MRTTIWQDWEVRAWLEGRKSRFTIPVKPQPVAKYYRKLLNANSGIGAAWTTREELHYPNREMETRLAPFQPGDVVAVRETWAHDCLHCDDPRCGNPDHIWYRASEKNPETFAGTASWRTAQMMPRWASRIRPKVLAVSVGRLGDMTHEDCVSEGCVPVEGLRMSPKEFFGGIPCRRVGRRSICESQEAVAFWHTWNARYANRGIGTDKNPWVWHFDVERKEA